MILFIILGAASYCCGIFGQSYGPVWLSNLGCSGSNGKLSSCSHTSYGSNNCNHTKDAGAGCRSETQNDEYSLDVILCLGEITTACTNGDVKLYRPYSTGPLNDGLALYCNNSRWVGFCDDGWSCHNARLICKKLGYPAALSEHIHSITNHHSPFPQIQDMRVTMVTTNRLIIIGSTAGQLILNCLSVATLIAQAVLH